MNLWIVRYLLWIWLVVLIVLNVIPLGNDANQTLSGKKIFELRLDYLIHFAVMLCFAWIWVLGKRLKVRWFRHDEALKYSLIVLGSGLGLELVQMLIPWRSFNPVDMGYNVGGAVVAIVVVATSGGKR